MGGSWLNVSLDGLIAQKKFPEGRLLDLTQYMKNCW